MPTMFSGKESLTQKLYSQETGYKQRQKRSISTCAVMPAPMSVLKETSGDNEKINREIMGKDWLDHCIHSIARIRPNI